MNLFGRKRRSERESLRRLVDWALSRTDNRGELKRAYGKEHAAELGSLGWLFLAIEAEPCVEPNLGRWQRFERELAQRLALLPPPTARFSALLPPLFILPAITAADAKAGVAGLVWKSAATAAVTTTVTLHLLSSGAVANALDEFTTSQSPSPVVTEEISITGNPILDHIHRNAAFLQSPSATIPPATAPLGFMPAQSTSKSA